MSSDTEGRRVLNLVRVGRKLVVRGFSVSGFVAHGSYLLHSGSRRSGRQGVYTPVL